MTDLAIFAKILAMGIHKTTINCLVTLGAGVLLKIGEPFSVAIPAVKRDTVCGAPVRGEQKPRLFVRVPFYFICNE